jgi:4-hydroxybenzoyl-CoA thioesterase
MNRVFTHDQLIRFAHCDPAAIVYFPRFFDLAHSTMEDWLAEGVGFALSDMIRERRIGTPTVAINCDFIKPLRMGDQLRFELRVKKLGNASVDVDYVGTKDGIEHLHITQTLVFMDLDRAQAVSIPDDIRKGLEEFLVVAENDRQVS